MVGFNIFAPQPLDTRHCNVWRENWQSVMFFAEFCMTQWRVSMSGHTGLDHTAVIHDLRTLRLSRKDFDRVYADVRLMERAALSAINAK